MDEDGILPGLGYLAAGLTAVLSKLAEEKFAAYGIAPVQFAILDTCGRGQMHTVMGLVQVIPMDQASISRHVAVLVERGFMQRIRHESDRRVVRLSLTDEGLALLSRLGESLREANPLAAMGLDEEEKRLFLKVMRKVWENLEAGRYGDAPGAKSLSQGRIQHLPAALLRQAQRVPPYPPPPPPLDSSPGLNL